MGALAGLIGGIIATIIVSHYYFKRSIKKSIGIYRVLEDQIFLGIDDEVRAKLRFTYKNNEVNNLLHMQFIVANDGERAISNIIEPLRLEFPNNIELLDASVLHRNPKDLKIKIIPQKSTNNEALEFHFPLLNRGEYFLVKILISGLLNTRECSFHILCDDIPREIPMSWLSASAFEDHKLSPDWPSLIVGFSLFGAATWFSWLIFQIYTKTPGLFVDWSFSDVGMRSYLIGIPAVLIILVFGAASIGFILSGFKGFSRKTRFPLPKKLRPNGFFYGHLLLGSRLVQSQNATRVARATVERKLAASLS